MLDKYHFGERKGTLYLEIYLNSFLEQVRLYAENYKHVCLVRGDGAVLYAQDAEGLLQDYLVQMTEVTDKQAVKVDRGYLLCESVEETGWKLCMLIPNEFLWERSQFVIFCAVVFYITGINSGFYFSDDGAYDLACDTAFRTNGKNGIWQYGNAATNPYRR